MIASYQKPACVLLLFLATGLAACIPSGTREAHDYYVLEATGSAPKAQSTREATLLIEPTTSAPFYDTQSIVFSRAPGTRAYYQFASFTQPPARSIREQLAARLAQSDAFANVVLDGRGAREALRLSTHLVELYHEAAQPPGRVRIVLSAELSAPSSGARVAQRTFVQEAPAPSYDAQGAVRAFNAALGRLLDEVIVWVDREAPR